MPEETAITFPAPEQIGKLTDAGRASAQAAYLRAYPHRRSEIEAAFKARPEPITPPPTPKPANNEAFHSPADGGLSYDQRLSGYRALLKHATDKAAVVESARRAGISLAGEATTDAILAELISQDEREAMSDPIIQDGMLTVPKTPSGYRLRYDRDDIAALSPDQVHRLDSSLRTALHGSGVPQALGQSILRAIFDTAGLYVDAETDVQRQLIFNAEGAKLRRMTGGNAEEVARKADAMYHRLPKTFREQVDNEYGFHSAQAQLALAKAYDAISLREVRKK